MKKFVFFLFLIFIGFKTCYAVSDLAISSKSAILMDYKTGEIIFEKEADTKLPPASMTKIMSMLLIMEQIDNGNLSFDDEVVISKNASSMGGSQLFLQENQKYKVNDLLKGIAVASGNDAVVAMAEKIGGTIEEFVNMMNNKAKELGLENTHFVNPHGLDQEGHYSSAKDMAIMARELIKHEKILEFTKIYEDYLKKVDGSSLWLVNTNKLVRFYDGVDGLKTGYTKDAMYCLTATAKKNDMRLISVVMGEPSSDERSKETAELLNYGFNTYNSLTILNKNENIGEKRVHFGKRETVNLMLTKDYDKLLKKNDAMPNYTYEIDCENLKAPINKGDIVGKLKVLNNGEEVETLDLTVSENILEANFIDYLLKNINHFINGKKVI